MGTGASTSANAVRAEVRRVSQLHSARLRGVEIRNAGWCRVVHLCCDGSLGQTRRARRKSVISATASRLEDV